MAMRTPSAYDVAKKKEWVTSTLPLSISGAFGSDGQQSLNLTHTLRRTQETERGVLGEFFRISFNSLRRIAFQLRVSKDTLQFRVGYPIV